jgi:hypothetical protein
MLIRHAPDLTDNDVTDRSLYLRRRAFIGGAAGLGLLGGGRDGQRAGPGLQAGLLGHRDADPEEGHHQLQQLLRIRGQQGGSVRERRIPQDPPLDGPRRRRMRGADQLRDR